MKKLIFFVITFNFLVFVQPAAAIDSFGRFRKEIREEIRNEVQQSFGQGTEPAEINKKIREEVREEMHSQKQNFIENLKNRLKKGLRWAVRITGTIASLEGNSLTVADSDGKTYKVNISDQTQLRRRFWGKSTLAEFSVGNEVSVIGRWTDETQTTIEAKLIRNLSIQRRWGVFFGTVTSKNADNFIFEAVKRGSQTVYFTGSTKFINRKQEAINYSDLQIGHRVRIKGVWDRSLNQIIEVEEVKDFSLPLLPTKTLTPTPTSL